MSTSNSISAFQRFIGRFTGGGGDHNKYRYGQKHGHWVEFPEDGVLLSAEGEYVDSKKHGKWILRTAKGDVYEGAYVADKKHGQWVDRFAHGEVAEGQYVDDKRHGHWVLRGADGDVHEGQYKDGK